MLCRKLLSTRHPEDIHPISQQLRHAITEQVERIREKAAAVVIIDRIVDQNVLVEMQAKKSSDASRQSAG